METSHVSTVGLRNVKLLTGLSDERIADVAARCTWRHFSPGQMIVLRNSSDRDVHFVVSGRVRVTSFSASGRQVTFRDEPPGETLGDLAAIDGQPRSADVLALDAVLVASLEPQAFRALIRAEPAINERVLLRLAALVRMLSERVIDLSTLGVQNRIHAELLRLARATAGSNTCARIDPAPKHSDVASQVSTYREQVTREISALIRLGLAVKEGSALVLPDVPRLERMVAEVRREA